MAKIPVERKSSGLPWWAWLLIALGIALLLWLLFSLFNNNNTATAPVGVVAETATNVLVVAPEDQTIEPLANENVNADVNANVDADVNANLNANVNAVELPTVDTSVIVTVEVPTGEVPTVGTADLTTAVVPTAATTVITVTAAVPAEGAATAPTEIVGEPISDVLTLISVQDQPSLIGRAVQLENVLVQRVTGDKTFFVGPSADQEFLAVLYPEAETPGTATEGEVDINAGQTVNLIGTIEQMPSIEEMQQLWNATPEEAAQLANQQVYMRVQNATIVGQ